LITLWGERVLRLWRRNHHSPRKRKESAIVGAERAFHWLARWPLSNPGALDPLCWLAPRNPFEAGPRWSMRARIENFISLVSLRVQSTNTWRVWQRALSLPGGRLPRDVLCSQANRYAPDMAGHAKIPVVEIDDCCWKSPIGLVSRRTNRPPLWSVIRQTTTSGKRYPELFPTDW
jgi:hypothetical protein